MGNRKITLRKYLGPLLVKVPVSLAELRALAETGKPKSDLYKAFMKLGVVNPREISDILGQERPIPPEISPESLSLIMSELIQDLVISKDPNISIQSLLKEGIYSSLEDDGKLSLIELLEKIPAEIYLDFDELIKFPAKISSIIQPGERREVRQPSQKSIFLSQLVYLGEKNKTRRHKILKQERLEVPPAIRTDA